ncbi:MAG TPA: ester cyclase [Acidimicrobiia bacterium]|nr:ester cyclase [Acidimicrobiia bacterium]
MDAKEALARRFYVETNARNFDAYDELVATDFVDHDAVPGQPTGLGGLKTAMREFASGFSDLTSEPDLVLVSGDYVTVHSRGRGTHDGNFLNVEPTGQPVEFEAIDIWLVKDGKLTEAWHLENLLSILVQMGALPT